MQKEQFEIEFLRTASKRSGLHSVDTPIRI